MAYEMVMPYHLHMPSYFLETFTEYPKINNHIFYFERKMLFKGYPNTQEHPFKTNIGHSLCKYIVCANRLIHQHLPFNFIRKKRFPANPSYQNQVEKASSSHLLYYNKHFPSLRFSHLQRHSSNYLQSLKKYAARTA